MTIIFCFTRIFRNSHRKIFSIETLLEKGYNVILLDLGGFFNKNISTCEDELMLRLRTKLSNPAEVKDFVERREDEPVLYVSNDVYLSSDNEVFRLLIRRQDKLLAFKVKIIPCQHQPYTGLKLLGEKFLNSLSGISLNFLKPLYLKTHNYFPPDYFLCSTRFNLPLKTNLTVKRKNIFIVHSDDVNRILEEDDLAYEGQRVGVFLDQVLPLSYKGKVPDTYFDEYYKKVSTTLLRYKEQLNLDKIIIAEHPEAGFYESILKDKYKHFERSRGNTHRLIKNASFVFGHFSASLGFAVYFKKPIILLVDEQLLSIEKIAHCIESYINQLKLLKVNMDFIDRTNLPEPVVEDEAYSEYVKRFMKDSSIKEDSYLYAIKKIEEDLKLN